MQFYPWLSSRFTFHAILLIGILCVCTGGCGSSHPETIPVSGTITLNGGPWPQSGTLLLTVVEPCPGFPARPVAVDFDVDGNFTVGTWEKGDGLMPGRYSVGVECWKQEPSLGGQPGVSSVPTKYQRGNTSGFEINVEPSGQAQEIQFDVLTEKSR